MLCWLLLAIMGIPAAWKLVSAGDGKSKAAADSLAEAASSPAASSAANGSPDKSSRAAVDFAAKAKSMLELRPGELGILPIPADFLGDLPDGPAPLQSGPQLRGMIHKAQAQKYLERALREDTPVQVKVGAAGDGLGWKDQKLDLTARLNNPDVAFPELFVETSAEGVSTKISMQVSCGTCAVVSYPSGESVLIVVGGGFPVGGLTREK
ncbi:hypothetical protein OKA05_25020 [Luteolibacter arcticus]|uniref:Uncharacterized protein n=1 Tax=Luteolibacter arcticus TaxID=1581411 RepID=A0ABT3GQR7_9BACT|nr:hypothetical protein [Luteolibacter arcticus]MCW1925845.1 hypothetical protein [Luteolibacter arcticus]